METRERWLKGQRILTAEIDEGDAARLLSRELEIAELSRELAVEPSVIRRWRHSVESDDPATAAAGALDRGALPRS